MAAHTSMTASNGGMTNGNGSATYTPSEDQVQALRERLESHGQGHVLKYWADLEVSEQGQLYSYLAGLDLDKLMKDFSRSVSSLEKSVGPSRTDEQLSPLDGQAFGSYARSSEEVLEDYNSEGLRRIAEGKVGVLLMAGGQGTRLGVDYPKGMYDVRLPSKKTLYQLQAERLAKVQELATARWHKRGTVPWYIMTSEATMDRTRDFFRKHNFFGLSPNDVIFFEQGTLPCMTFEGKMILADKGRVAKAPDGNGGLYRALAAAHILEDMKERGVEYVQAYCVDNILIKMADPVFIGYCAGKGVDCAAKVVEKTVPTEPVGMICRVQDRVRVVEYSEMSLRTAQMRGPDGRLKFNCANICIHFFARSFLEAVVREHEPQLQHHVAKKKIPFIGHDGSLVKPKSPNGIKLEKFVFDVFQFAELGKFAVWEVIREDEFSPLKNADGADKDTPTTARHSVFNLHYRQLMLAGARFKYEDGSSIPEIPRSSSPVLKSFTEGGQLSVENGDGGQFKRSYSSSDMLSANIVCEISPLVSYNGEGLEAHVSGKNFHLPLILQSPREITDDTPVIIRRPSYVVD